MIGNIPAHKLHHTYRTIVMGWDDGIITTQDSSIYNTTLKAKALSSYKQKRWWQFWRMPSVTYTCLSYDRSREAEFFTA